jgi:predicted hydrocarbon binding protein
VINVSGSERKERKMDAENVKEILGVVSSEVPALVKSLLASVFSEEAGKSMGKAAAAYYKELKNGGIPEQVAVKMTEDYMKTFTNIGEMFRGVGRREETERSGEEIGREIERRVREKVKEAQQKRGDE